MADVCIKSGTYCPICKGSVLADCWHSTDEFTTGPAAINSTAYARLRADLDEAVGLLDRSGSVIGASYEQAYAEWQGREKAQDRADQKIRKFREDVRAFLSRITQEGKSDA